jgi:hypothetical protein
VQRCELTAFFAANVPQTFAYGTPAQVQQYEMQYLLSEETMNYIPFPDYRMGWIAVAFGLSWMFALIMIDRSKRREARAAFVEPEEIEEDDMSEQLTFDEAIAQRDAVLEDVVANNSKWMGEAMDVFAQIRDGTELTGEGFRQLLLEKGLRQPAHANSWGALIGTLTRRKVLVPTGEWRPMLSKAAHGRKTQVLVKAVAA